MTPPCHAKHPAAELVWDGVPQLGGEAQNHPSRPGARSTGRQALTHHHGRGNISILKRKQFGKMHQGSLVWFQLFYSHIYTHTHISNF